MKKKVLSAILCIAMVATMLIGCTTESPTSSDDSSSEDSGSKGGGKGGGGKKGAAQDAVSSASEELTAA